jgi:ATP-dependent RNA helicase DDX3X
MSDFVTAATGGDTVDSASRKQQELNENLEKLKEKGWNNPVPFNYETVASGDAAAADERDDEAPWLGNAAVYEWDDDFGEVGPPNGKLEEELFRSKNAMRAGNRIMALSFDVSTGGSVKVEPVREVWSPPKYSHYLY